jgi:hypothetical protein
MLGPDGRKRSTAQKDETEGRTEATHFLSLVTLALAVLSIRRSEVLSVLVLARGASGAPEET